MLPVLGRGRLVEAGPVAQLSAVLVAVADLVGEAGPVPDWVRSWSQSRAWLVRQVPVTGAVGCVRPKGGRVPGPVGSALGENLGPGGDDFGPSPLEKPAARAALGITTSATSATAVRNMNFRCMVGVSCLRRGILPGTGRTSTGE